MCIHRSRVEGRQRDIPGWYELEWERVDWERVERGRHAYEPLSEPRVVVDAVNPPEHNLELVMRTWLVCQWRVRQGSKGRRP